MANTLSTTDHRRDVVGLRYVYPVISRRAGGVSVGINLNPDNKCNFRCVYCQVPGLQRGMGPAIDLDLLEGELRGLLVDIVQGDFMERRVPEGLRHLRDVALSGNGEPTSSPDFEGAIERVRRVLTELGLLGALDLVLITNGTLIERPSVLRGLALMAELRGQVWFKLDRATEAGMRQVNDTAVSPQAHLRRLGVAAAACPTWVQTCLFLRVGQAPPESEIVAYLDALESLVELGVPLQGVLLYGLARPSQQPEASELSALSAQALEAFGQRIRDRGLTVKISL